MVIVRPNSNSRPEPALLRESTFRDRLKADYGIDRFERTTQHPTVQTIGYSPRTRKWYGWSHRAIAGFAIGSTVRAGDVLAAVFPVGHTAKTEDDAKAMAAAFADQVA